MAEIWLSINGNPWVHKVQEGPAGGVSVVTIGRAPNVTHVIADDSVSNLNVVIAWRAARKDRTAHWGVCFLGEQGEIEDRPGKAGFEPLYQGSRLRIGKGVEIDVLKLEVPGATEPTRPRKVIQDMWLNAIDGTLTIVLKGDRKVSFNLKRRRSGSEEGELTARFLILRAFAGRWTRSGGFPELTREELLAETGLSRPNLDQVWATRLNPWWRDRVLAKAPGLRARVNNSPFLPVDEGLRRFDVGTVNVRIHDDPVAGGRPGWWRPDPLDPD